MNIWSTLHWSRVSKLRCRNMPCEISSCKNHLRAWNDTEGIGLYHQGSFNFKGEIGQDREVRGDHCCAGGYWSYYYRNRSLHWTRREWRRLDVSGVRSPILIMADSDHQRCSFKSIIYIMKRRRLTTINTQHFQSIETKSLSYQNH